MASPTYPSSVARTACSAPNWFSTWEARGWLTPTDAAIAGQGDDLVALSVDLVDTPCGPFRKGHGFPDREVGAIVAAVLGA